MKVLILSGCTGETRRDTASLIRLRRVADAVRMGGMESLLERVGSAEELERLLDADRPDLVFSAAAFTAEPPEGRTNIHGILERKRIAFIGSSSEVLELALSKHLLKRLWRSRGVPTPGFFVVDRNYLRKPEPARLPPDGFPYILKPATEGNSRGIGADSVVRTPEELDARAVPFLDRYGEILAERYLGDSPDIREFTVALIGSGERTLLMPAEIFLKERRAVRVITTSDKDNRRTGAVPVEEPELKARLLDLARRAFRAAGVRDYARCDILQAGGALTAIEINGQPMVPDDWFGACAEGSGMDTDRYLNAIFLAGIARTIIDGQARFRVPQKLWTMVPPAVSRILTGSERSEL